MYRAPTNIAGRGHLRRPQQLPGGARPEPPDFLRNLIAPPILVLTNDQEKKGKRKRKWTRRSFVGLDSGGKSGVAVPAFRFFEWERCRINCENCEFVWNWKFGRRLKMLLLTIEIEVSRWRYELKMPLTCVIRKDDNIWRSLWLGIIGFEASSIFVKNSRRVVDVNFPDFICCTIFWNDYKEIRLIVRYVWLRWRCMLIRYMLFFLKQYSIDREI